MCASSSQNCRLWFVVGFLISKNKPKFVTEKGRRAFKGDLDVGQIQFLLKETSRRYLQGVYGEWAQHHQEKKLPPSIREGWWSCGQERESTWLLFRPITRQRVPLNNEDKLSWGKILKMEHQRQTESNKRLGGCRLLLFLGGFWVSDHRKKLQVRLYLSGSKCNNSAVDRSWFLWPDFVAFIPAIPAIIYLHHCHHAVFIRMGWWHTLGKLLQSPIAPVWVSEGMAASTVPWYA